MEAYDRGIDRAGFLRLAAGALSVPTLSAMLAACGGDDASGTAAKGKVDGAALRYLGLDGEDGKKEGAAFRARHKMTLQSTYMSSNNDLFAKLKAGQVYDLALVPHPYIQPLIAAKLLTPLDLSAIPNHADLFPNLRNATWAKRGKDTYATQIAWGDGPYVYVPKKVPAPPKSIGELFDASWHKRYILFDGSSIFMLTGRLLGFNPPSLTPDQLKQTADKTRDLVKGSVAFASGYEDATDLLSRGEADLSVSGWEAMLNMGKAKGVQLGYAFFTESHGGGWSDSLAVPVTAKSSAAAHAYINAMISPDINAALATNLISGVTNQKALPKVPAKVRKLYDYSTLTTADASLKFENWTVPSPPGPGIASQQDWEDAWQSVKAG